MVMVYRLKLLTATKGIVFIQQITSSSLQKTVFTSRLAFIL